MVDAWGVTPGTVAQKFPFKVYRAAEDWASRLKKQQLTHPFEWHGKKKKKKEKKICSHFQPMSQLFQSSREDWIKSKCLWPMRGGWPIYSVMDHLALHQHKKKWKLATFEVCLVCVSFYTLLALLSKPLADKLKCFLLTLTQHKSVVHHEEPRGQKKVERKWQSLYIRWGMWPSL